MINNPKSWVRKNKKAFANRFVTDSHVEPHEEPAGFFMAGLPGAGKTEFTKNLIKDLNLRVVRIDMDELAVFIDGYSPEQAYAYRSAASDLLSAVFDRVKHRGVDFIMDGTFKSGKAIDNLILCNKKGYYLKLFIIHQDPLIAWEFTKDREKVEKRAIDKNGFIDTYFKIFGNLTALSTLKIDNFTIDLVIKDADNKIGQWYENVNISEIDSLIEKRYNKDELERMLQ